MRPLLLRRLNVLLVFVPLGLAAQWLSASNALSFALNGLAIVPLAGLLSLSTEAISEKSGPIVGALLNCSFGNAVELLIAFVALQQNLTNIVKASVVGGVLCNLLVVMGMAIMTAGWSKRFAEFNAAGAMANVSALQVANLVLILPTIFDLMPKQNTAPPPVHPSHGSTTHKPTALPTIKMKEMLAVSRWDAVLMLLIYLQFVYFQLKTHPELFMSVVDEETATSSDGPASLRPTPSFSGAVAVLLVVTVLAALTTDNLVTALNAIPVEHSTKEFLALIALPLIGQASEFASCLNAAQKGDMDLVLGIGVGSCCQTMLFVLPLMVLYGWVANVEMDLKFHEFDMVCLIFSVFLVSLGTQSGKVTWINGSMLLTCYVTIAIIEYYMPNW